MNIALMAEDSKKELMVQFCIAYCGILAHHTICATDSTGCLVAEDCRCTVIFPTPTVASSKSAPGWT